MALLRLLLAQLRGRLAQLRQRLERLHRRGPLHHRRPSTPRPPVHPVGLQPVPRRDPASSLQGVEHFAASDRSTSGDQLQDAQDLDAVHVQRRGDRLQGHPGERSSGRGPAEGQRTVAPSRGRVPAGEAAR